MSGCLLISRPKHFLGAGAGWNSKGGMVLLVLEDYDSYYCIYLFHILSIKIQLHVYS